MKILLISPMIAQPKTDPPSGLCYIQACLDKAGYKDSKIIDETSYDEVKKIIKNYRPDVVGISCFTMYRGSSLKLAKMAREIKPDVKVILGGPHATFMWEQIMKNFPFVDFIVVGEGEITTLELIRTLDKNTSLRNVKGIIFRENGELVKTESRPFIENLDELPFPSYRDINFEHYAGAKPPEYYTNEKKASIISSRGCVFNCNFCSTTQFWTRRWRARSAKNVVDEIEWLYKEHDIKFFTFFDDIFTTNTQRVIEICKEIIKRDLKIKWYAETRVDCISKEMLEWMKKSGCCLVQFGVESGSDKILKSINKKITREQIINAFRLVKEVGMKTETLLMVGNPGETKETIEETKSLLDTVKPDIVVVSVTRVFPSTQLYDLTKQQGFISDDFWLTEKTAPEYTVEHPLSKLLLMRLDIVKHFYKSKGRFEYLKYFIGQITSNPRILTNHLKVIFLGRKTLIE